MSFDPETIRLQIPHYLTAAPKQKALVGELKALSEGASDRYFFHRLSDPYGSTLLQGDGWRGFQVFSFETGARRSVSGIVLSNSCDVAPENTRSLPPKITFASIVKLSAIRTRFTQVGLKHEQIEAKLTAIREQAITSMFFLPAGGPLDEDYVALLDDVHSMPVAAHDQSEKLFTLSMAGFYLFVFKLSVHFCRLQEDVDRSPHIAAA